MKLKSFFSSPSCFLLQIILVLLLLQLHQETATAKKTKCPPSHCGKFTNIMYPFRLKGDPANCGDPKYELACVNNSTLLLPLFPGQNYHVKAINYNNFTIRLVDPAIQEGEEDCSSFPRYFLSARNFPPSSLLLDENNYNAGPYDASQYRLVDDEGTGYVSQSRLVNTRMFQHVVFMNCSNPVRDDPLYVDSAPCSSSSVNSHDSQGHVYAIVGDLLVGNFKVGCNVKLVTLMSVFGYNYSEENWVIPDQTFSYDEIHRMLVSGFEVSWMGHPCQHLCGKPDCFLIVNTQSLQCKKFVDYCRSPLGFPITCGTGRLHKLGIFSKGRIFLEEIIVGIGQDLFEVEDRRAKLIATDLEDQSDSKYPGMDRKWMFANRLSDEYAAGVKEFVKFAVQNAKNPNSLLCPCLVCWHGIRVNPSELEDHLICKGIDKNYICWSNHGESRFDSGDAADSVRSASFGAEEDACDGDRVEEMAKAVEDDLRDCPQMFERLKNDAGTPLYNGCSKFTRLSAVLKLYNLKAANGWTDTSFTNLLTLLKDMLPEGNVLPGRLYEAKQMLCSIGMSYERIHACPNDCILFRNEYESLKSCPKCKAPRYKKENSCPLKVLWYFPIIPRFRRMYRSAEVAKQLTWHKYRGEGDGMLRHPADSPQWSKIDSDYSEFGKEERNLRLALSTDGIKIR